ATTGASSAETTTRMPIKRSMRRRRTVLWPLELRREADREPRALARADRLAHVVRGRALSRQRLGDVDTEGEHRQQHPEAQAGRVLHRRRPGVEGIAAVDEHRDPEVLRQL